MNVSRPPEYIAECLWPGVTRSEVAELDTSAAASAAATAAGAEAVRYLGSVLLPADEVVFCFFSGPSSAAVEAVARDAGIPFERVLESVRIGERETPAVDESRSLDIGEPAAARRSDDDLESNRVPMVGGRPRLRSDRRRRLRARS